MTLATLSDVLVPALKGRFAVPGFVCLGWEDARAYALAAQAESAPVILQAGPGARSHMPVAIWGTMFRTIAAEVDVPVVAHLDHGASCAECRAAIDAGFSSVMFDGSRLPLGENIDATAEIAQIAHDAGLSCEGEIGFVGYFGGADLQGTVPHEAARFARETGVDAMAVSVGNVHLQATADASIDIDRLRAIEALTGVPLVIHGGSGIAKPQRTQLGANSNVCKINIGTELRQTFGAALRDRLARDPEAFDRIAILHDVEAELQRAARLILRELGASGRA